MHLQLPPQLRYSRTYKEHHRYFGAPYFFVPVDLSTLCWYLNIYLSTMPHALSQRPIYTADQLSKYLALLFHPKHPFYSLSTFKESLAVDPLATLSTLQRHHLGTIPWGDLSLHYSVAKSICLNAEDVFEKIVVKKHGGYCMEINTFYSTVLRSLGIKLYTTAGRISNVIDKRSNDPEGFAGW
jgi:hypothetical protein